MARLRHRFSERPCGIFGIPPRLGNPALPHREKPEAVAPPGRVQRDLSHRADRAPWPRARSGAARDRQDAQRGELISFVMAGLVPAIPLGGTIMPDYYVYFLASRP